jgi:hypothetical protein
MFDCWYAARRLRYALPLVIIAHATHDQLQDLEVPNMDFLESSYMFDVCNVCRCDPMLFCLLAGASQMVKFETYDKLRSLGNMNAELF